MAQKLCSRCGGTGLVSRGQVINGVCFKCGGDGKHRPQTHISRSSSKGKTRQFALVNAKGQHLAINTDRGKLETLFDTIPGASEIVEF